jgi:hypothetical protein
MKSCSILKEKKEKTLKQFLHDSVKACFRTFSVGPYQLGFVIHKYLEVSGARGSMKKVMSCSPLFFFFEISKV